MELFPLSLVLALLSLQLVTAVDKNLNLCNPANDAYSLGVDDKITVTASSSELGTKDCACDITNNGFEGITMDFDLKFGTIKYTTGSITHEYTPENTDVSTADVTHTSTVFGNGTLYCEKSGETGGDNKVVMWGSKVAETRNDSTLYFDNCGKRDLPTTAPDTTAANHANPASRLQIACGLQLILLALTLLG